MTRLNLILFFVLIVTALGSVTAQHKSRKYYIELQQQQDAAKQYDIEWGQLQLEQSTWAMHSRVESVASQQLHMQVPDSKRIQVVVTKFLQPAAKQGDANAPATNAKGVRAADIKDSQNIEVQDVKVIVKPKP